jgi:hypothetical protein
LKKSDDGNEGSSYVLFWAADSFPEKFATMTAASLGTDTPVASVAHKAHTNDFTTFTPILLTLWLQANQGFSRKQEG